MPVLLQVVVSIFVRVAVADPPIGVRSAMTVETLFSPSLTVHCRVVVVFSSPGTEAGVNAQPPVGISGGVLVSVTVSVDVIVSVFAPESVAVTVTV